MRLISPHRNYSIKLADGIERAVVTPSGITQTQEVQKPLVLKFSNSGLLDHEAAIALEKLNFKALPEGVHPLTTVGVADTELLNISDEARKEIEDLLRVLEVKYPGQFIIVDLPVAPKPWESYDEQSVEAILEIQKMTGTSPLVVRRYEEENEGRKTIIEAMLELERESAEAEVTVRA